MDSRHRAITIALANPGTRLHRCGMICALFLHSKCHLDACIVSQRIFVTELLCAHNKGRRIQQRIASPKAMVMNLNSAAR